MPTEYRNDTGPSDAWQAQRTEQDRYETPAGQGSNQVPGQTNGIHVAYGDQSQTSSSYMSQNTPAQQMPTWQSSGGSHGHYPQVFPDPMGPETTDTDFGAFAASDKNTEEPDSYGTKLADALLSSYTGRVSLEGWGRGMASVVQRWSGYHKSVRARREELARLSPRLDTESLVQTILTLSSGPAPKTQSISPYIAAARAIALTSTFLDLAARPEVLRSMQETDPHEPGSVGEDFWPDFTKRLDNWAEGMRDHEYRRHFRRGAVKLVDGITIVDEAPAILAQVTARLAALDSQEAISAGLGLITSVPPSYMGPSYMEPYHYATIAKMKRARASRDQSLAGGVRGKAVNLAVTAMMHQTVALLPDYTPKLDEDEVLGMIESAALELRIKDKDATHLLSWAEEVRKRFDLWEAGGRWSGPPGEAAA